MSQCIVASDRAIRMLQEASSAEEIQRLLSLTRRTRGTRDNSRVCHEWKASGMCREGDACRFMHSEKLAYAPVNYQNRVWSHSQVLHSAVPFLRVFRDRTSTRNKALMSSMYVAKLQ